MRGHFRYTRDRRQLRLVVTGFPFLLPLPPLLADPTPSSSASGTGLLCFVFLPIPPSPHPASPSTTCC